MPFAIPSLNDLVERARQSFRANLPGTDAWLWPNNIGPTAKVIGGQAKEVFGYAEYIARQKFAMTASGEELDFHAYEVNLSRRAASSSEGTAVLTASGALAVSTGAILARSDGVEYRVTAGGSIPGSGSLELPIQSVDTGLITLAQEGAALTATSGVTGALTAIEIGEAGAIGGNDIEDDESLRQRVLFRKRNPPQGGSAADYVIWASEVPGVTRVFVERLWAGPGTVRVFPIFDDEYNGGVAPAARIEQVADYLETRRPAGAALTVSAPNALTINVTVAGLTPNTASVQNAIRSEMQSTFRRLGRVAGIDTPSPSMPYLATSLSFSRSWLWQAAANASGEQAHSIASPAADISVPIGSIPVLGTVTFS